MNQPKGLDDIPEIDRLSPHTTSLLVLNGPKAHTKLPLNPVRNLIGRSILPDMMVDIDLSSCELGNPPMISRHHAVMEWIDGKLYIQDLSSRNGTEVEGEKLVPTGTNQPSPPVVLRLGSLIKLANLEFKVVR